MQRSDKVGIFPVDLIKLLLPTECFFILQGLYHQMKRRSKAVSEKMKL